MEIRVLLSLSIVMNLAFAIAIWGDVVSDPGLARMEARKVEVQRMIQELSEINPDSGAIAEDKDLLTNYEHEVSVGHLEGWPTNPGADYYMSWAGERVFVELRDHYCHDTSTEGLPNGVQSMSMGDWQPLSGTSPTKAGKFCRVLEAK